MTHFTKSIAYAFPTSTMAKELGFDKTGCFYVQQTAHNIEGSGQAKTFAAHNAEGFAKPNDPDLVAFYHETEGKICPHFLRHGNTEALRAIGIREYSHV